MFLYHLKNFIVTAFAFFICLAMAFFVKVGAVTKLSALTGERVYFLHSASSQGLKKTELALRDLDKVKGECVRFDRKDYEGGRYASKEEMARAIAEKFHAEIRVVEEVLGVTSYYCYVSAWTEELFVDGQAVNLHIALSKEECVVGTPIIFDGF